MNQEERALHLLDVIESDQADVGIWESLGAVLDLSNNLSSVSASEHWQLPHGPVSVVKVVASDGSSHASSVDGLNVGLLWGRELQAWGVSIADNVVNLLDDLVIRERWEERESLEELVVNWVPHLHKRHQTYQKGRSNASLRDSRVSLPPTHPGYACRRRESTQNLRQNLLHRRS